MDSYRHYRKRKHFTLARHRISLERKPQKHYLKVKAGSESTPSGKQSSGPNKRTGDNKGGNILTDAPAFWSICFWSICRNVFLTKQKKNIWGQYPRNGSA